MLSYSKFSVSPTQWIDKRHDLLISSGLVLVTIGTTAYILNKVLNSSSLITQNQENRGTNNASTNRVYSTMVKNHLRATYAHVAGGLVLTSGFAYLCHRVGWPMQLLTAGKWQYLGGAILITGGSCLATLLIDENRNPVSKYTCWALANSSFGLALSPLFYYGSSLLMRAAILSLGVVGSISVIAMTAQRELYIWLGAPLITSVSVICLAQMISLFLPETAIEILSVIDFISLYGGLATFCGILLWDTHKIITKVERAENVQALSPINDSFEIYLDIINIFTRILRILKENEESKKKKNN